MYRKTGSRKTSRSNSASSKTHISPTTTIGSSRRPTTTNHCRRTFICSYSAASFAESPVNSALWSKRPPLAPCRRVYPHTNFRVKLVCGYTGANERRRRSTRHLERKSALHERTSIHASVTEHVPVSVAVGFLLSCDRAVQRRTGRRKAGIALAAFPAAPGWHGSPYHLLGTRRPASVRVGARRRKRAHPAANDRLRCLGDLPPDERRRFSRGDLPGGVPLLRIPPDEARSARPSSRGHHQPGRIGRRQLAPFRRDAQGTPRYLVQRSFKAAHRAHRREPRLQLQCGNVHAHALLGEGCSVQLHPRQEPADPRTHRLGAREEGG